MTFCGLILIFRIWISKWPWMLIKWVNMHENVDSCGWRICVTPAACLTVTHSESQSSCHPQYNTHTPPDGSRVGCGHTSVRREREKDEGAIKALEERRTEDQGDFTKKFQLFLHFLRQKKKKKSKSERFLSVPMCCGWSGVLCTCYIVLSGW